MGRNDGFGVKFCGVGGRAVHAPIASFWFGGSVERSERSDDLGSIGCLCIYCTCERGKEGMAVH
jgi:hypothetical protein